MASTSVIERVPEALLSIDVKLFRPIFYDLTKKIQSCAILSGREHMAQIGKTWYRFFGALAYISTYAKCDKRKPTAFKCSSAEACVDTKFHEVAAIERQKIAGWEERRRKAMERETPARSLFKRCKNSCKNSCKNCKILNFLDAFSTTDTKSLNVYIVMGKKFTIVGKSNLCEN